MSQRNVLIRLAIAVNLVIPALLLAYPPSPASGDFIGCSIASFNGVSREANTLKMYAGTTADVAFTCPGANSAPGLELSVGYSFLQIAALGHSGDTWEFRLTVPSYIVDGANFGMVLTEPADLGGTRVPLWVSVIPRPVPAPKPCDPAPGADFSHCSFAGRDLSGVDFSGSVFIRSTLGGSFADFRNANLSSANLRNTRFCPVAGTELASGTAQGGCGSIPWTLRGANLSGADLRGSDLTEGSPLPGVPDARAILIPGQQTTLAGAKLGRVGQLMRIEDPTVDLSDVVFGDNRPVVYLTIALQPISFKSLAPRIPESLDLACGDFAGGIPGVKGYATACAVLAPGFDLRRAEEMLAAFTKSLGSGAWSTPISLPSRAFRGADLSGANLRGANLDGANLERATTVPKESAASSSAAKPVRRPTDLRGASMKKVNLRGANLSRALLAGVKSSGIAGKPSSLPRGWKLRSGRLVKVSAKSKRR